MKVLFVQKMAGISGSERYFLAILPELRKRGIDASFLVVQHPNNREKNIEFINILQESSIPVDVIDARWPLSPGLIVRLAKYLRDHHIDVLQTNLIHADVWGGCVKLFFNRRLCLVSVKHGYEEEFQTRHGLDPSKLRFDKMSILTRWAARFSDRVVCISRALESFLVQGGLVDSDKVATIPYGFDFSGVVPQKDVGSLRFGRPQIIVAGRLVPVKQHHLLLGILPDLAREFPHLSVVMVGSGPLIDELQTKTTELGLSSHVRWEGFRSNMHDYIRDSDVMVVPSAAEGFGLVVLEAWFHAKPVVAFDVAALNEIVDNGVNGLLVTPFDTDGLLNAMRSLLSDPQYIRAMGEAGKIKQTDTYGIDAMTDRTISVYRQLHSTSS